METESTTIDQAAFAVSNYIQREFDATTRSYNDVTLFILASTKKKIHKTTESLILHWADIRILLPLTHPKARDWRVEIIKKPHESSQPRTPSYFRIALLPCSIYRTYGLDALIHNLGNNFDLGFESQSPPFVVITHKIPTGRLLSKKELKIPQERLQGGDGGCCIDRLQGSQKIAIGRRWVTDARTRTDDQHREQMRRSRQLRMPLPEILPPLASIGPPNSISTITEQGSADGDWGVDDETSSYISLTALDILLCSSLTGLKFDSDNTLLSHLTAAGIPSPCTSFRKISNWRVSK